MQYRLDTSHPEPCKLCGARPGLFCSEPGKCYCRRCFNKLYDHTADVSYLTQGQRKDADN